MVEGPERSQKWAAIGPLQPSERHPRVFDAYQCRHVRRAIYFLVLLFLNRHHFNKEIKLRTMLYWFCLCLVSEEGAGQWVGKSKRDRTWCVTVS